jgi:hypothetical protein
VRILLINDYRRKGGCEVLLDATIVRLRNAGHDVSLFTSEDVPAHRRHALGYVDSRRCRSALRRRIEAFRPELVHLHNFYHELSPGVLAELGAMKIACGFRVVMTAHDHHLVCPNPALSRIRRGRWAPLQPPRRPRLMDLLRQRWDARLSRSWLRVMQHVWNYRLHDRRRAIDLVICPSRVMAWPDA